MAKTHMRYRLAHSREIKKNRWNNVCPECGRRGKFSPYIDTVTNEPIAAKECGRCCREKSCAYHMTPSEWFKEHPTEKREWLPREQYVELMKQRRREARVASYRDTISYPLRPMGSLTGPPSHRALCSPRLARLGIQPTLQGPRYAPLKRDSADSPIAERNAAEEVIKNELSPFKGDERRNEETERRGYEIEEYSKRMNELCLKSRSDQNNLARWLATRFPAEQVAEVLARYRTGSTRDGRIIYWQIDEQGQVRAGKVMAYGLDGHRVKKKETHPNPPFEGGNSTSRCQHPLPHREGWGGSPPVCWVHSMKIDGIKFDEMLAPQCLFGLHLIETHLNPPCEGGLEAPRCQYPLPYREGWGGSLCIVESEKTALIMSLVCPDKLWLATGGKANFKESMLWPLLGHEVAVYPDADALRDWELRIHQLNRELGHRLYIPTGYYNLMDHEKPRTEGWDLADAILREE